MQKRNAIGICETDQIFIDCKENIEFLIPETPINQKYHQASKIPALQYSFYLWL